MKKKKSLDKIEYIVKLANLPLTESELRKFASQVSEIIDYNASHLKKKRTENVEPTAHTLGIKNRLRKDETQPSLSASEALKNSKEVHNNFFKVKVVLDQLDLKEGE